MSLLKSADFIADVQRQAAWYAEREGWELADRYLEAVEATCQLLAEHPQLGPRGGFHNRRLRHWRFFLVFRPFQKHILFYELEGDSVMMHRAMHGGRNLRRRLLQPPAA